MEQENYLKSRFDTTKLGGSLSFKFPPNFTPRAQQALALARKEADRLNHHYLGTEHLLLGLIKLGQGVAVSVLEKMGLDLETVRMEVERQVGTGLDQKITGSIPYTPRVKKVLALASKEAKALNHSYVGTEHILLGLLREGNGVAAKVLKNLDVDVEQTRQEILRELDPNFSGEESFVPTTPKKVHEAKPIAETAASKTPPTTPADEQVKIRQPTRRAAYPHIRHLHVSVP